MEQAQVSQGQIKKQLKQLKQRQDQYLYYLGQLAFQAAEQGRIQEPEILEAYKTMLDIQTQIAQWEASMEQARAAREAAKHPKCPHCGAAVAAGSVFCPGCGAALAAPPAAGPAPSPVAGRVCTGCGSPLDDDAAFCGVCGMRVAAATAPPVPQSAAVPAPTPAPAAPAPTPAAPAPGTAGEAAAARCPGCGGELTDPDIKFCPDCGTKVGE